MPTKAMPERPANVPELYQIKVRNYIIARLLASSRYQAELVKI